MGSDEPAAANSGFAFFITRIGAPGSAERHRTDDVSSEIVEPCVNEAGLRLIRADQDPTPGQITSQIVRSILEARVVIADMTGRNPNVYYELGLAHAFQRPVVLIIDKPGDLAFDAHNERVIPIGDDGKLGAREARDARSALAAFLQTALRPDFVPESIVTATGRARSVDELAETNPMAKELSSLREEIVALNRVIAERERTPQGDHRVVAEHSLMCSLIQSVVYSGRAISHDDLLNLITPDTRQSFDTWLEPLLGSFASGTSVQATLSAYNDEEPF